MDRRLYCISSRAHQERASPHDSLGDGLTIFQKELSYKTLHWTISGTIVYFFLLSPRMQRSARGHSAAVLMGNGSDMQAIRPVMYRL